MNLNVEWSLNSDGQEPLHLQFEKRIRAKIDAGDWKPGDKIPSERDLMEQAGISRATVRQTIGELVHQRLLQRIHGRGTFVSSPRYEQPLEIVYSFSEQLRLLGFKLEDQVLNSQVIEATPDLVDKLRLTPGEQIIYLRRLRSVRGIPMMVGMAFFPYTICPDLLNETFGMSLYRLLTEKYGLPVVSAVDHLEAVSANAELARHLKISPGSPLMYVERVALTTGDIPLHVGYHYIRGDMCRFKSTMHAQPTSLELKPPLA